MSDEYIKTNDVVNAINVLLDNVDASEDAMNKFCDSMNDIQKVEIVRCKDCKYLDKGENDSDSWCECTAHFGKYFPVTENEYCSYGERAEE